jgi:hypothetical protein
LRSAQAVNETLSQKQNENKRTRGITQMTEHSLACTKPWFQSPIPQNYNNTKSHLQESVVCGQALIERSGGRNQALEWSHSLVS